MPLFTPTQLTRLLDQQSISAEYPWNTNNTELITAFYKSICDDLTRATGTLLLIQSDHGYGSGGYASYVEASFYKETADFQHAASQPDCVIYHGPVVLLSLLSPHFVLMEGCVGWRADGIRRNSYLPNFQSVDEFTIPSVLALSKQIQPLLEARNLKRLAREELSTVLPDGTAVPTILCDPPYREFDALFHWAD